MVVFVEVKDENGDNINIEVTEDARAVVLELKDLKKKLGVLAAVLRRI